MYVNEIVIVLELQFLNTPETLHSVHTFRQACTSLNKRSSSLSECRTGNYNHNQRRPRIATAVIPALKGATTFLGCFQFPQAGKPLLNWLCTQHSHL